jgi:hypothetical protein
MLPIPSWIEAFSSYTSYLFLAGTLLIAIGLLGKHGVEIKEIRVARLETWQIAVSILLGSVCLIIFVSTTIYNFDRNIPYFEVTGKFIDWNWYENNNNKFKVRIESKNGWEYDEEKEVVFGEDFRFPQIREGSYHVYLNVNDKTVSDYRFMFDKGRNFIYAEKEENERYRIIQDDWLKHMINAYNNTPRRLWERRNKAATIVEELMNGDDSQFVTAVEQVSLALRILEKTCHGNEHTYDIQEHIMNSTTEDRSHIFLRMRSASGLMCAHDQNLVNMGRNFLSNVMNNADNQRGEGQQITAAYYLYKQGEKKNICVIDKLVEGLRRSENTCRFCEFLTKTNLEDFVSKFYKHKKDEITKWEISDWESWWNHERKNRFSDMRWKENCVIELTAEVD